MKLKFELTLALIPAFSPEKEKPAPSQNILLAVVLMAAAETALRLRQIVSG